MPTFEIILTDRSQPQAGGGGGATGTPEGQQPSPLRTDSTLAAAAGQSPATLQPPTIAPPGSVPPVQQPSQQAQSAVQPVGASIPAAQSPAAPPVGSSIPQSPAAPPASSPQGQAQSLATSAAVQAAGATPVGMAATAAMQAGGQQRPPAWQRLDGKISPVASTLTQLASGDEAGAVTRVANGLANVAAELGPVGMAVAATTKVFIGASEVIGGFIQRGKELGAFNADLAISNARAEISGMQNDFREAQDLGPGIARLTDMNTEFQRELFEILLPIRKLMVDVLGDSAQEAATFIRDWKPFAEEVTGLLREIYLTVGGAKEIAKALSPIFLIYQLLKKQDEEAKKADDDVVGGLMAQLKRVADNVPAGPVAVGPNQQPVDGRLAPEILR